MGSRQSDRQRLERLLATDDYQAVLNRLREEAPALSAFDTWADVVAFMQAERQDPRKDDVLRALFHAHTQSTDPRFRTILLVLFWTALLSIHHQKRAWDADPDELWQNITWAFLKVLCRIDLTKRPTRLAQKVYNDTIHHLHDTYRHSWNRAQRETTAEPDRIIELAGAVAGVNVADIEQRQEHQQELTQLRAHVAAGRLSEADYLLVVGTRKYVQSVADYARQNGLDYQVAKKRRQRAEATIRQFENKRDVPHREKKCRDRVPVSMRGGPLSSRNRNEPTASTAQGESIP